MDQVLFSESLEQPSTADLEVWNYCMLKPLAFFNVTLLFVWLNDYCIYVQYFIAHGRKLALNAYCQGDIWQTTLPFLIESMYYIESQSYFF